MLLTPRCFSSIAHLLHIRSLRAAFSNPSLELLCKDPRGCEQAMPAKQRVWEASQLHEIAAAAALHKAAAIQRRCGSDGQAVACRRFVVVNAIVCMNLVHVVLTQGTLVLSWVPRRTTSRARPFHPARWRLSGPWAMRRAAAQRLSLRFAKM